METTDLYIVGYVKHALSMSEEKQFGKEVKIGFPIVAKLKGEDWKGAMFTSMEYEAFKKKFNPHIIRKSKAGIEIDRGTYVREMKYKDNRGKSL